MQSVAGILDLCDLILTALADPDLSITTDQEAQLYPADHAGQPIRERSLA